MEQLRRRLAQGTDEGRVAVAERVHGDAGEKIPVDLSVRVSQARALPLARMKRRPCVGAENVRALAELDSGG